MKINKKAEQVTSSEVYYDLFDGGYINPQTLLGEGAQEVIDAIALVTEFLDLLENEGKLIYS